MSNAIDPSGGAGGAGWGRRALPYVGLIFFGLVLGMGLLAAAEAALRILDINGAPRSDPFAGFSSVVRMFQPTTRDGVRLFMLSPGRAVAATGKVDFGPQRQFLADKRPGVFRIFTVGDSSAAGVPYGTGYAFTYWLERRLTAALPQMQFEVVNAAMPGYATRRLVTVVEEIVSYAPDLIIIYNGHNEFAERRYYEHLLDMDPRVFRMREWLAQSRLWSVTSAWLQRGPADKKSAPSFDMAQLDEATEMFAVLDERANGKGYPTARERAYGEILYRTNMEKMVRTIQHSGARVMLMTQSQNFASWAPGASAHRENLSAADHDRWVELVTAGDARAQNQDCAGALAEYERAVAIDDQYADLIFRMAHCEEALGRYDAARARYRRASDLDQVPHGAPTNFNDIVTEIAQAWGTLFTDADGALTEASSHGLVGDNFFADWVHPNIKAHQIIAAAMASTLQRAGVFGKSDAWVGGYVDPDADQILADNPPLRMAEHMTKFSTCMLAHRTSCALPEIEALMAMQPDNPGWAKNRQDMLKRAEHWRPQQL